MPHSRFVSDRARRSPLGAVLVALAIAGSFATGAAQAQTVSVSARPTAEVAAIELRVSDGKLSLTLDEAVSLALARNLDLEVERFGREQAVLGIAEALGLYDFNLSGSLSASDSTTASVSRLEGAAEQKQQRQSLSATLSRLLPTGGTLSVTAETGRFDTNSTFFEVNPSFSSGLEIGFVQPLLRDYGRTVTERLLVSSRYRDEASRHDFVARVTALLGDVEFAYWNLHGARSQLSVAEAGLELAKKLHEQNRVRVEVGTLAPLELVQSEAGVLEREEAIIRAQLAVGNAEDSLRALLNAPGEELWRAEIVPSTAAETARAEITLAEAIERAERQRPELASLLAAQKSLDLDRDFYRNQLLPRLDLSAGYGYAGSGGDVLVRDDRNNVIRTIPGGVGDAWSQIADRDFPGWSLALTFAYPLENRAAKARSSLAGLAADQGRKQIESLELAVATEVRAAVRGVEAAAKAIDSARASERAAEKNLEAEQKKYQNGLSTSFQVLQIQDDLTAARSRLVQAVVGYRQALVEYYRSTGALPEQHRIEIADSGEAR